MKLSFRCDKKVAKGKKMCRGDVHLERHYEISFNSYEGSSEERHVGWEVICAKCGRVYRRYDMDEVESMLASFALGDMLAEHVNKLAK